MALPRKAPPMAGMADIPISQRRTVGKLIERVGQLQQENDAVCHIRAAGMVEVLNAWLGEETVETLFVEASEFEAIDQGILLNAI